MFKLIESSRVKNTIDENKQAYEQLEITCKNIERTTKEKTDEIKHVINTICVCRTDTSNLNIKSVIHFGDIVILSEKKYSKFAKWLWKKVFNWVIEDYHWGTYIQKRIFLEI